jgi:hypothetical protein
VQDTVEPQPAQLLDLALGRDSVDVLAVSVLLDEPTRAELQRTVRAGTSQVRAVLRAKIVLAAADGAPNARIAADLHVAPDTVRKNGLLSRRARRVTARRSTGSRSRAIQPPFSRRSKIPVMVAVCRPVRRARAVGLSSPCR